MEPANLEPAPTQAKIVDVEVDIVPFVPEVLPKGKKTMFTRISAVSHGL